MQTTAINFEANHAGGDFDQIESVGLGLADRILSFQDAELLAGGADDDADFAGANAVVDTNECRINGASVRLRRNCGGCLAWAPGNR